MPDNYEKLVRWYLRFNGYLSIENFVVHEPRNGHVPEGAEFDTLAVRFPYSREQVDQKLIQNDPRLEDCETKRDGLTDFVIAEVKSGKRNSLNRIWHPEEPTQKIKRVAYLLRWLGPLDTDDKIEEVATALQSKLRVRSSSFLFRLVYFAHATTTQAVPLTVPQITFSQIAEFVVSLRTPKWKRQGIGVKSQHEQWDEMIRQIWEIGSPENNLSEADKVSAILQLLKS
jgi:hypothetical protein